MTRLWDAGERIDMEMGEDGMPLCFTWNNERHAVQSIAKRWRVDIGWWRLRVWRDYYKLVTTTGLLAVVYHDLALDQWNLQRVYD